jgi:DNA polymerase-4
MPRDKQPVQNWFAAITLPHFIAQAVAVAKPDVRGKPFAVVEQDAESHKTIVTDVSPAAEARGVHPGTPVFLLRRKFPGVAIVPRDKAAEAAARASLRALWVRCTPDFTVRENGGAMLDMTGTPATRRHAPHAWAAHLRTAVLRLGFESVAVGVASSQVVARVLSRGAALSLQHRRAVVNPADPGLLDALVGVVVCAVGEEERALDALPPGLLPGLSPSARGRLRKYGLETIAAVRRLGKEELTLRFGTEGEKLYTLARGLDMEPVVARRKPLLVETILPRDLNDEAALRNQVRLTADKLCHALRADGVKTARFTMILDYADGRSARRTHSVRPPTAAFVPLAEAATALFFDLYQRRVALRRIRLSVAAPAPQTGQRELFEGANASRSEALAAAIDRIRIKRSFDAVLSGSNVGPSTPVKKAPRKATRGPSHTTPVNLA